MPRPANYPSEKKDARLLIASIYLPLKGHMQAIDAYLDFKRIYLSSWKNDTYMAPYDSLEVILHLKKVVSRYLNMCEEKEMSQRKTLLQDLLKTIDQRELQLNLPNVPTHTPVMKRGRKTRSRGSCSRKTRKMRV